MTKVAVVSHSGEGHTEVLAHLALQGMRDGGTEAILTPLAGQADDLPAELEK